MTIDDDIQHLEECITEANAKFAAGEWDADYCIKAITYYKSELQRVQEIKEATENS